MSKKKYKKKQKEQIKISKIYYIQNNTYLHDLKKKKRLESNNRKQ